MAERRMFAKTIIDSDAFLEMPLTTQCLYFHLSMRADDDGFINNPNKIQRMIGATKDDLKLLIAKGFVIPFESGIVVIKHWKIHNYIQKDRYKPTIYKEEKAQLITNTNSAYTLDTECIQDVSNLDTQARLGKVRLGKVNNICVEINPTPAADPKKEEPRINLTLNTGEQFPVYEEDIKAWKDNYPAIDIMQELRKMRGWLDSNPKNRKTKSGIKRFINAWLARTQDKAPRTEEIPANEFEKELKELEMLYSQEIPRQAKDIDNMT